MATSAHQAFASVRMAFDDHEVVPPPESPTSIHLPGEDALRVLLLGDGPAVGFTVTSHELALGGHLARTLSATTGRGVIVDIRADSRMTPHDALERAKAMDLARYDAAVLTLGSWDAVRSSPARAWADDVRAVVEHIDTETRDNAPIVVGSIPPLRTLRHAPSAPRPRSRSHADMLNIALAATELPDTAVTVQLTDAAPDSPETATVRRRRWAGDLVAAFGDAASIPPRAETPATRREERRRVESLRRSRVLESTHPASFDWIVDTASSTLGTSMAALNFIDDAHLWVKSSRNVPVRVADRANAFCDQTIRATRTLVSADTRLDRRFAASPWTTGPAAVHFYAGHPIESPEGDRIGSLCVLDSEPRPFSDDDAHVLQELAFRVQNELYLRRAS